MECIKKIHNYLFWESVIGSWKDVSNEGAVFNVLVVANDVHGVVAGLGGPVVHVARAVAFVVAFNFSLRWAFNGKTWPPKIPRLASRTFFTKSCCQMLAAHPEFRHLCQSPPPQSRQIFQPCPFSDRDPRLSPSEHLPQHPLLLQTDCRSQRHAVLHRAYADVHC